MPAPLAKPPCYLTTLRLFIFVHPHHAAALRSLQPPYLRKLPPALPFVSHRFFVLVPSECTQRAMNEQTSRHDARGPHTSLFAALFGDRMNGPPPANGPPPPPLRTARIQTIPTRVIFIRVPAPTTDHLSPVPPSNDTQMRVRRNTGDVHSSTGTTLPAVSGPSGAAAGRRMRTIK